MRKILIGLFFGVAVLLVAWELQRYASSGTEFTSIPLSGTEEDTAFVNLREDMSPVRVILSVDYEIELQQGTNPAYGYRVEVLSLPAEPLISSDQIHIEQHADQGSGFEIKTESHVIGTFTVPANGSYEIRWELAPKKAVISGARLAFRQQVSPLNIFILIAAGLCFVFGVGTLLLGRKKRT